MSIRFTIPGRPQAKERPRTANGHTYTPRRTKDYETLVSDCWHLSTKFDFKTLEGPLEVSIVWAKQVPKSWSKKRKEEALWGVYAVDRMDLDNVTKSVLDALNGLAYHDDSQVAVLHVFRVYVTQEDSVTVEISELRREA